MGLISSRLNLESLNAMSRQRSHQDETLYSYSLNKNYFSNYFLMGGERFEVNDPDYLFGDNSDLNFLSCTKPCSLPYKQAQQNLLSNLSTNKQKAINKVSSRVNRLGSTPFNIFNGRLRRRQALSSRKQESQIQNSNGSKGSSSKGSESSQPLVMLINIRKETLRLVKSSTIIGNNNPDSDINSLTNSVSISSELRKTSTPGSISARKASIPKQSKKSLLQQHNNTQTSNRHSATSSRATTSTIHPNEANYQTDDEIGESATSNFCSKKLDSSDIGSLVSATSSLRSGYASVKGDAPTNSSSDDDDDDEDFEDALNDTTNLSLNDDDDDDSEKTQQQRFLLLSETKENRDIKITIEPLGDVNDGAATTSDSKTNPVDDNQENGEKNGNFSKHNSQTSKKFSPGTKRLTSKRATNDPDMDHQSGNRVYNIEFEFDTDVDCSIRIFYFCTREITSAGISYKPQHATYKSKIYYYKKGLNQKFDHQDHTFQPYLFDEDLLIYKPLDLDGNYNSGAVFPLVIHCIALEGPTPRQSQSLVATIEKSQLDDSYSIKPLKQLIFVDGVQYILQDIYGIENKPFNSTKTKGLTAGASSGSNRIFKTGDMSDATRGKSHSLQSSLNGSHLNLSDTASVASVDFSLSSRQNRGSLISNNRVKTNDNSFECVICMSEERDTMLLPCRHLCLCSACATSLRYQANSCPICRCPFRAALNLRPIQRAHSSSASTVTRALKTESTPTVSTSLSTRKPTLKESSSIKIGAVDDDDDSNEQVKDGPQSVIAIRKGNQVNQAVSNSRTADGSTSANSGCGKYDNAPASRRESVTTSASTPLLSATPLDVVVNLDSNGRNSSSVASPTSNPHNNRPNSCGYSSPNNKLVRQSVDSAKPESSSSAGAATAIVDDCRQTQGLGESGSLEMRTMNVQWRPSEQQQQQ